MTPKLQNSGRFAAVLAACIAMSLIIAWIDLEEGVRMPSNLVDCEPTDAKVGMAVQVTFEQFPDGAVIPVFCPADR